MRKMLLMMVGIALMLTGCSQDEVVTADNQVKVSFNVSTDHKQSRADAALNYICEVYEGANSEVACKERHTSQDGNFTIALEKEKTYSFLFWANAGSAYNVENLKAVALTNPAAMGTEAWAGKLENQKITDETEFSVNLKHAVAQIQFKNTAAMAAGEKTIKVTYPQTFTLNVSTNTLTEVGTNQTMVRQFTTTATGEAVIATDYIFAPAEAGLITLKLQTSGTLGDDPEKEIANFPVQMNHTTTLKGVYYQLNSTSFSTSLDAFEQTPKEDTL